MKHRDCLGDLDRAEETARVRELLCVVPGYGVDVIGVRDPGGNASPALRAVDGSFPVGSAGMVRYWTGLEVLVAGDPFEVAEAGQKRGYRLWRHRRPRGRSGGWRGCRGLAGRGAGQAGPCDQRHDRERDDDIRQRHPDQSAVTAKLTGAADLCEPYMSQNRAS